MSNSTSNSSSGVGLLVFGAVGYIVEGGIFGISNALIGCSIAKYSALRSLNQYILLMSLAFSDAISMFGYVSAGIYRLFTTFGGTLGQFLSPTECLSKPHVILWMLGHPASSLMLAVLSADRLFLVAFPNTYLLSLPTPGYSLAVIGCASIGAGSMFLLGIVAAFHKPSTPSLHPFCYLPDVIKLEGSLLSEIYVFYYENIVASMALASVFIFALVLPVHKYKSGQQPAAVQAQDAATQRHMTVSLGISAACTLFLYCIPLRAGFWAWAGGNALVARCFFLLSMTNPFANCFIYQLRHDELKKALRGLVTGKTLPPMLTLWKGNKSGLHNQSKANASARKQDDRMELKSV